MSKVTKAVFPVAGLGSRFLPATKASPKEMLPIVDKPLIQYAVEEAIAAGITELIFITGRNKRAIEDHFDKAYELETELATRNKSELLAIVQGVLPKGMNCVYIRQAESLGLGHAVLCAQHVIGDEAFAILLADDLIDSEKPVMQQMVELYAYENSSIIGVQNVPRTDTASWGIVQCGRESDSSTPIIGIVEKPKPEVAPSTLAVVGRYILRPRIFHYLRSLTPGAGGEIQLTDAIGHLLKDERVLAYRFAGTRYDCGSKLGYLQAMVAFGLKHREVGEDFRAYLADIGLNHDRTL